MLPRLQSNSVLPQTLGSSLSHLPGTVLGGLPSEPLFTRCWLAADHRSSWGPQGSVPQTASSLYSLWARFFPLLPSSPRAAVHEPNSPHTGHLPLRLARLLSHTNIQLYPKATAYVPGAPEHLNSARWLSSHSLLPTPLRPISTRSMSMSDVT